MRTIRIVTLVATLLVGAAAHGEEREICRGTVTLGGPWIAARSTTVLLDEDGPDGFFCEAPSDGVVATRVVSNPSGGPYALSLNFHGRERGALGRRWLGGCSGTAVDQEGLHLHADIGRCPIPPGATTLEVTAYYGAALEVAVYLVT